MSQGMDTATELLKEVYVGRINNQLDSAPTTYNRIKRVTNAEKYGGKYVDFPIHIERNTGIGARKEREALPQAGKQGYREAHVGIKSFYGAFELTGQAFDLAEKGDQSFGSLVKEESTRIRDDLMVDRNRQCYGDGTGTMATVTALPAGQVISVSDITYFQDGMRLSVYQGASTTERVGGLLVTDIDEDDETITVSGSVAGIAIGDSVARDGNGGDREWLGLSAIVDDASSLYGISHNNGPNGSRHWRSHVNNNGDVETPISELMLARMMDKIKHSGGKTSVIMTTPGVLRAYWALLEGKRRFVNTQKFDGGYTGLSFSSPNGGEIPFLADDDCQTGTAYFLDESKLDIYRPYEYKLIERGGSTWKMKTDADGTYDIWQSWLVEHSQIGTKRRNTHGKITNIQEDASL